MQQVWKMAGKTRISVGLSASDYRELSAIADQARVSLSWLGERAVAEFLERHRNNELQLPLGLVAGSKGRAA